MRKKEVWVRDYGEFVPARGWDCQCSFDWRPRGDIQVAREPRYPTNNEALKSSHINKEIVLYLNSLNILIASVADWLSLHFLNGDCRQRRCGQTIDMYFKSKVSQNKSVQL